MMMLLKLILFWVQLLVFDKKRKNFMKKESTNFSNTLKNDVWCGNTSSHWYARILKLDS